MNAIVQVDDQLVGSVPLDMRPTSAEELKKCLSDPLWRLSSLYKILVKAPDKDGDEQILVQTFKPNRAQRRLIKRLHKRNLILKARQLGFTTFIAIYFLDCALFGPGDTRAGIIAHNDEAAEVIFRDKVKFAYERLPEELRNAMPLERCTTREIVFHNNSSIRVGTSMRSGTLQYLHVSEFGKICAKFPERAREVLTGSIPAAEQGIVFIESTAEGREGAFYEMSQTAQKNHDSGKKLTRKDYRFHFFPWHEEDAYTMDPEGVIITAKDHEYFDKLEAILGKTIDQGQRAWYVETRETDFQGEEEMMWQEYPSTPEEPFQVSTKGCYYTTQMTTLRKRGGITTLPYQPGIPVNTFWDIGNSDGTAIWFHQKVGRWHHFIKFIEGWEEPYAYFVQLMQATGWVWGKHYLPHDGAHVRQGMEVNLSPREQLEKLGLRNIEIVPQVQELQHGIQAVREVLSSCLFDEEGCKEGIDHLDLYKKRWIERTGTWSDQPLKDVHTEGADSFRCFAQAFKIENELYQGRRPRRRRASGMAV